MKSQHAVEEAATLQRMEPNVEILGNVNDTKDEKGDLTFVHRLEITFIKLLKLYYTPGRWIYALPPL